MDTQKYKREGKVTGRKLKAGTHQEHNVQGVRTYLEDDFRKALNKYKEVTNKKHQRSVRRSQEISEEVKHEKLT